MGLIWGPKAIKAQSCICNSNTLALNHSTLDLSFRFSFALLQFRFPSQSKIMGVTKEDVEASLTSKMNPTHLEVIDTSGGCGASFAIEIVSEQFEGKRLLERHRMVNTALVEEMKNIHALSIKKALTPTQWSQHQESNNTQSAS